jgi:amino acid transporter
MFITALLVLGTKESARFNLVITVAHLVLVVFIIIAGMGRVQSLVHGTWCSLLRLAVHAVGAHL